MPRKNNETNENPGIPKRIMKIMKFTEFHMRIMKIMKILKLNAKITKIMKILEFH